MSVFSKLYKLLVRCTRCLSAQMLPMRLKKASKDAEKLAILIATPTHGNLGDHAIVRAEIRFLSDLGFTTFEVERFQYERLKNRIAHAVREKDFVVIDGGGNVGTLWPEESDKMNDIIVRFHANPVAVFPQTAYFEDSSFGESCKCRVSAAYSKNPSLLFFSRDHSSYEIMNQIVPGLRNFNVPDIVLYLDESRDDTIRDGALLCLRVDKERVTVEGDIEEIYSALAQRDLIVRETTTVVDEPFYIGAKNRDAILETKWDEFRSAEVVVTDRLHGMIFSAITGTPCVALDNVSRKVSQGYEWIRYIGNIRIAESIDEVSTLIDEVLAAGPCRYDRAPLDLHYDEMRTAIQSVAK